MPGLDYKYDLNGPIRGKYLWPTDDYEPNIRRVLQLVQDHPTSHSDIGGNWTIGTLPTMLSALQLYSSFDRQDDVAYKTLVSAGVYWTLQTSKPLVMSACSPIFYHPGNISYFHVNGSTSILQNATEFYDAISTTNESDMSWIQMPQDPTSLLALFMSHECLANDSEADSSGNYLAR
jgi:hypothetical protein